MPSRIRQALRTYTTRRGFWRCVVAWFFFFVILTPGVVRESEDAQGLLFVLIAMGFFGSALVKHVELQFTDPRARLLPRFASAHVLAAGAMIAAIAAVPSMIVGWRSPILGLSMAGFGLAFLAVFAWSSYRDDAPLSWLVMILCVLTMTARDRVMEESQSYLVGGHLAVSLTMLLLGLVGLGTLVLRLCRLSEEMPEYSRHVLASTPDSTSPTGKRSWRRWESQRGRLRDAQFRALLCWAETGSPLRCLLLQRAASGFSGTLGAMWLIVLSLVLVWRETRSATPIISAFVALSVLVLLVASWVTRSPYLSREFLHPVSRAGFAFDLIGWNTFDMIALAIAHFGGLVAGLVLFHSQGLSTALERIFQQRFFANQVVPRAYCCFVLEM